MKRRRRKSEGKVDDGKAFDDQKRDIENEKKMKKKLEEILMANSI